MQYVVKEGSGRSRRFPALDPVGWPVPLLGEGGLEPLRGGPFGPAVSPIAASPDTVAIRVPARTVLRSVLCVVRQAVKGAPSLSALTADLSYLVFIHRLSC